jgi:hypothetical protein
MHSSQQSSLHFTLLSSGTGLFGGAKCHEFNGTLRDPIKLAVPGYLQVGSETLSQGGVELFDGGRLIQSRRSVDLLKAAKDGRRCITGPDRAWRSPRYSRNEATAKGNVRHGGLRRSVNRIVSHF